MTASIRGSLTQQNSRRRQQNIQDHNIDNGNATKLPYFTLTIQYTFNCDLI
jgi:hypothetical protein